jgi:hypothetical protein
LPVCAAVINGVSPTTEAALGLAAGVEQPLREIGVGIEAHERKRRDA